MTAGLVAAMMTAPPLAIGRLIRANIRDGLDPLIDHITSLGLQFGLWVEPEMVNPDSNLYRAHPDWILGPKDQLLGRQQLVLDMARDEVKPICMTASPPC